MLLFFLINTFLISNNSPNCSRRALKNADFSPGGTLFEKRVQIPNSLKEKKKNVNKIDNKWTNDSLVLFLFTSGLPRRKIKHYSYYNLTCSLPSSV